MRCIFYPWFFAILRRNLSGTEAAMKLARSLLIASLAVPALPAAAAPEDGDRVVGHMLTLVQSVVRIAAHAETPQESLRAFDEVLAGRNADVRSEERRVGKECRARGSADD